MNVVPRPRKNRGSLPNHVHAVRAAGKEYFYFQPKRGTLGEERRKCIAGAPLRPLQQRGLVFHGLRKSAVVFMLEAGCTDAEVSAVTGQSRQMVEHYARLVDQEKLAASAVVKWEADN